MLKMTRKLQKVLGLVQQKLIIDYNYRLVLSIYIYQEENRFKSSITPAIFYLHTLKVVDQPLGK